MGRSNSLSKLVSLTTFLVSLTYANATIINIVNNCPFTVWPASFNPSGGQQLDPGQTWTLSPPDGNQAGRIWGRTGCNFDGNGNGNCQTGDCGGVLHCTGTGKDPQSLAEYSLARPDFNQDSFDISLIEGFNVPISFIPTSNNCGGATCSADLNPGCPQGLKTTGGCNNPCSTGGGCGPGTQSDYFNQNCPDAYGFPDDRKTKTCPAGTNYQITFCP